MDPEPQPETQASPNHYTTPHAFPVPLGTLITNKQHPALDCYQLPLRLDPTISTNTLTNPTTQHTLGRTTETRLTLPFLSLNFKTHRTRSVTIRAAEEKYYTLQNSRQLLHAALSTSSEGGPGASAYEWLAEKDHNSQKVYMVVGIHTLTNPQVVSASVSSRRSACCANIQALLHACIGLGGGSTSTSCLLGWAEPERYTASKSYFEKEGEVVWAIEYQRVRLAARAPSCVQLQAQVQDRWQLADRSKWVGLWRENMDVLSSCDPLVKAPSLVDFPLEITTAAGKEKEKEKEKYTRDTGSNTSVVRLSLDMHMRASNLNLNVNHRGDGHGHAIKLAIYTSLSTKPSFAFQPLAPIPSHPETEISDSDHIRQLITRSDFVCHPDGGDGAFDSRSEGKPGASASRSLCGQKFIFAFGTGTSGDFVVRVVSL